MARAADRGFTLVELLLVVSLLGLSAVIVVPALQPANDLGLEQAAGEFADAVRFARSEALRTGQPHGYTTSSNPGRIRVYRLDLGTSPPTPVYDVRHPVTQRVYDVYLADLLPGAGLSRSNTWSGSCNAPSFVSFDENGAPRCRDPLTVVLTDGALTLSLSGSSRDVAVSGVVGRVVVQ